MDMNEAESVPSPEFMTRNGDLFEKHFPPDLDEQSMILKAHLLLEAALRDFCAHCVPNPQHLLGARFQFNQVLSLAQALCPIGPNDFAQKLWAIAKEVNKLRNAMAHELEPDAKKIDGYKKSIMQKVNDEERGRSLDFRACLEYTLGAISAFLQFALLLDQYQSSPSDEET
ncbi:hypothetical protein [Pseudomonas koreensis]|uniref:hypothetical protein n=1 Tax=Pseudomonas koreensis TaxID=198620 RepID=UPI00320A61D3